MLNYDRLAEKESIVIKSPNSKTLITSFLPRQLLINSNYNRNSTNINMNPNNNNNKQNSDSSQQRPLILHSISQFLDSNGFSKSLKYFLKEANIQKDEGGSCLLNIEEMCFEYLKSRNGAKEELGSDQKCVESAKDCEITKEDGDNERKKSDLPAENDAVDVADVKSKKKKKKSKIAKGASEPVVEEALLKAGENEKKKSELPTENVTVNGNDVKSKKKKINKTDNGASEQVIEDTMSKPAVKPEGIPPSLPCESGKKLKDKKKKLKKESEHLDKDLHEKQSTVATTENTGKKEKKVKKERKEKNGSKIMEENVTDSTVLSTVNIEAGEEKKESKKRKKPSSDENGADHIEKTVSDDSKRRKTDNSDQSNGNVQPPKTPVVTSAEPKVAKAFQRVKPEDVEFADERLQDNSYWAKDGADSGYGAKAQEVLGQVRGRDFRHEKTKKKRGSYRGGQIDLHTHSVKFNYDNEDE